MKLHELLRYLSLSVQYASDKVSRQAAQHFLDHYPDGKPHTTEFETEDGKRALPSSSFRHHRAPGVHRAKFKVESDVLPGGEVSMTDEEDVSEELRSLDIPLKRGLFRRAAQISVTLELVDQEHPEGIERVHEHYLSHPAPIPPKEK